MTKSLTSLLNISLPIIQAPMAGGVTTSALVAAVSKHGGLGMIGAGYLNPEQLRRQILEVKELTGKSFGVNLFIPNTFSYADKDIIAANKSLQLIRTSLNIQESMFSIPDQSHYEKTYREQLKILIEEKVPVCSFTFGFPGEEEMKELKDHGTVVIGTATTVKEAILIEKMGMDMVVVQGSEAGGHRGSFLNESAEGAVGLFSLIPQAANEVKIPVIAAGGIMDGRGLIAALSLGAKAVQMGTAFLTCEESGAHTVHKEAILQASEDNTILTRTFSGKWARGIKNAFITKMSENESAILPFPVQNTLTQDIRKASAQQGNSEYMSLWSGQSPRLAKSQNNVKALLNNIIMEAEKIKRDVNSQSFSCYLR